MLDVKLLNDFLKRIVGPDLLYKTSLDWLVLFLWSQFGLNTKFTKILGEIHEVSSSIYSLASSNIMVHFT